MKKCTAILAGVMMLVAASCAWADVPIDPDHFQDDIFGPYLFNFDTDGDGTLSDAEIANITELHIAGMGISSIEGIHYLTNLRVLYCENNSLTALDVGSNTVLNEGACSPQLRLGLNVTASGYSAYPYQLDLTEYMTSAQTANVSDVQGKNPDGSYIATIYSGGVAMFASRPGRVSYSYDTGRAIMDVTIAAGVAITPENFPDEVFGPLLFNFDTDGDGILSDAEIAAIEGIHVQDMGIKSLEGIRYLTAIKQLNCTNNSIESLDVHGLTELEFVWCANNNMKSLDVSGCTALKELHCQDNSIASFSIEGCYALEYFHARESGFTGTLDLHGRTSLVEINCRSNTITSLDLSGCTALTTVYARSNQLAELNITDCDALEILNCGTNQDDSEEHTNHITTLDLSGKSNLKELICKRNGFTALDLTDCTALVSVDCSHNQLASLNVSNSTALEYLVCGHNNIRSLDVTHNTKLTHLDAWDCGLSEIDVSANTELEYLELGGENRNVNTHNRLTMIDVSNNKKLTYLAVDRNLLTEVDVSGLPLLETLMFQHNDITSIDISHNQALKELYCQNCGLNDLDLSANTALTLLRCYSNDIATLDLSHNPLISDLQTGASGIMSELPVLKLKYSPDRMPYRTDMKDYVGSDFTEITSLKAYTSEGGEILTSFMDDGTASFAQMPMKVVYTYDTGYTGSADISADMKVAIVPDPDNFFTPLTVSVDVVSVEKIVSIEKVVSPEIRYITRKVVSPEIRYITRYRISRDVVVSKEIEYISTGSNSGCNALSGSFILSGLTFLAGLAVSLKKH